jgi:hypothetical protein
MLRNKIMQNIKYEQLKKRNLHDFVRKARDNIIKSRPPKQENTQRTEKDYSEDASLYGNDDTARESYVRAKRIEKQAE